MSALPRNLQTILDTCAEHMMVRSRPAIARNPDDPSRVRPQYRGANGTKCPVGLFIPDASYSPDLETLPLEVVLVRCGLMTAGEVDRSDPKGRNRLALLRRLQQIHDAATGLRDDNPERVRFFWASALLEEAGHFGLRVPPFVRDYFTRDPRCYSNPRTKE
jgi:hypothetical protein